MEYGYCCLSILRCPVISSDQWSRSFQYLVRLYWDEVWITVDPHCDILAKTMAYAPHAPNVSIFSNVA